MKKTITLFFCLFSTVILAQQKNEERSREEALLLAETYLSSAESFEQNENLSKAIEYYLKTKSILGTQEYSSLYVRACIGLGNIYNDVYDTYEAINHFKEGINHQLVFNLTEPIPQMYVRDGLGKTLINEGNYEHAEALIQMSVITSKSHNDSIFAIESLNNLVYILGLQNKIAEAESAYVNLEELVKDKNLPEVLLKSIDVSKFVIGKKELNDIQAQISSQTPIVAKERFLRALHKVQLNSSNKNNIITSYKRWDNFRDSIRTDFYKTFTDSLQVRQQKRTADEELSRLQIQEQFAQNEISTKNRNIITLISILVILSLLISTLFFFYRRNKKQKEVIESLQKELHHRIKNNLSIIDTFIEVAKEEFEDPKFSKKLTELQNRIDSINEVHQQLYKNKDVTNLNLKNYVDTLAKNVESSFSNNKITIEKTVKDQLHLHADKSFPVGLIINEFLTNSYKYAFDSNEGKVKIEMNDLGSDYQLLLSDNGKGLPENFDLKTSDTFGLRIMKLLTEQLNGEFRLSNNNGVNLIINFPK